jgi:hypothetical protein
MLDNSREWYFYKIKKILDCDWYFFKYQAKQSELKNIDFY